jgi:pyruvate formate lyase activating enzyme
MENGMVFNIQHYSIHDGPGIRTSVFLKGCFLHCLWCQNPESQSLIPELFYFKEKCMACGRCVEICPEKANHITGSELKLDRNKCKGCGRCIDICPNDARSLLGKKMTAEEVFNQVKGDELFYKRSKGGMTLTGGEPLFQPEFSKQLLMLCRQAGIHTALETCGYADWETLKDILQYVDLVLFDLKQMDTKRHQEYTGAPNGLVLDNARKICHTLKIPIWARLPIIPGYNDTLKNIHATAEFIVKELSPSVPVHLLAYHRLGETKYERLGQEGKNLIIAPPGNEYLLELQKITASYGLDTIIGG